MASMNEEKNEAILPSEEKELVRELTPNTTENNEQIEIGDDKLECPKYVKEDSLSGYLFNKDEIDDYKRKQQIDIMRNQLLGEFDDAGNYYLSPEILNELKNAKKEIIEQYKTYIFLHTVHPIKGYGNVSFFVSMSKLPSGELKSKLVLLEKVEKVNGFIINTISAPLDEFVGTAETDYYEEMKKHFNIVKVDQKDINEDEDTLKYCTLRKLQLSELWRNVEAKIEKIEKSVFEKKLKALKSLKNNPFAQQLLEEFYKESAKIDKIFLRDTDEKYIALNALLDECFDRLSGKMPIEEKQVETILLDAGKDAIIAQAEAVNSIIKDVYQKVEKQFYNPEEVKDNDKKSSGPNPTQPNKEQDKKTQKDNEYGTFPGEIIGSKNYEKDDDKSKQRKADKELEDNIPIIIGSAYTTRTDEYNKKKDNEYSDDLELQF